MICSHCKKVVTEFWRIGLVDKYPITLCTNCQCDFFKRLVQSDYITSEALRAYVYSLPIPPPYTRIMDTISAKTVTEQERGRNDSGG